MMKRCAWVNLGNLSKVDGKDGGENRATKSGLPWELIYYEKPCKLRLLLFAHEVCKPDFLGEGRLAQLARARH